MRSQNIFKPNIHPTHLQLRTCLASSGAARVTRKRCRTLITSSSGFCKCFHLFSLLCVCARASTFRLSLATSFFFFFSWPLGRGYATNKKDKTKQTFSITNFSEVRCERLLKQQQKQQGKKIIVFAFRNVKLASHYLNLISDDVLPAAAFYLVPLECFYLYVFVSKCIQLRLLVA